ncbi:2859_t:CDS:1, partial [Dentiscutata heterogama]
LIRREYLYDMGIDLEYIESLNTQAIKTKRATNQRSDQRLINLESVEPESNN